MRSESRNLLLASSSRTHGTGYLDHCSTAVEELFHGVEEIGFVPYALADHAGYAATVAARFEGFGIAVRSLHESSDPITDIAGIGGLFIGGGNTFRLLNTLQTKGLLAPIRERARAGMPYLGTSAGSNVAGATIRTTNDMPIVQPTDFAALGLVDFQINPHYIDADPSSSHQGETRAQRLHEFHEENDAPVVGLREGAWLRVAGTSVTLEGDPGGILFRRDLAPEECTPGTKLAPGPLDAR